MSLLSLWQRLQDWWRWEPLDFRATGLGQIMKEPSAPKPTPSARKKPTPTRPASGHLRVGKRRASKRRSPRKGA